MKSTERPMLSQNNTRLDIAILAEGKGAKTSGKAAGTGISELNDLILGWQVVETKRKKKAGDEVKAFR